MKLKTVFFWLTLACMITEVACQGENEEYAPGFDYIEALKDTLARLGEDTDNKYFEMHCASMISVINSRKSFTKQDSLFLTNTYHAFNNISDTANGRLLSTYLNRQRPFIFSWVSPTDGAISFSWFNPPKNWDPKKSYPLYIQLHGLWNVAANPIEYLTYPFTGGASDSRSFEDGYLLSPWGRGNLWYLGISETDIWECIHALEKTFKTDPSRKYLSGHSMGGFGALSIASKSSDTWAAIGIHAGALWHSPNLVTAEVAEKLKNVPTYFVCGTMDGLLGINQTTFGLFEKAGNQNIEIITFEGGHEYKEENVEKMYLWLKGFVKPGFSVHRKRLQ